MNELDNYKGDYNNFLMECRDTTLFELNPKKIQINSQFKSLEKWVKVYIGIATAELHNIKSQKYLAIKDENRNAILPQFMTKIDDTNYYLSVKGCGAYEDMFFGDELTIDKIKNACQDQSIIPMLDRLNTGVGFIMSESWLGESPYGAQGIENANDELNFSKIANKNSINGAYICPVIGIVQLPEEIEKFARKFFWFRRYPNHFYQVLRIVPSTVRLYFESSQVVANPKSFLPLFGINSSKSIEQFELNFIRSGIALLSLYARSIKIKGDHVSGIYYKDVWLDKDAIVAPKGIIHFADLEGLIWKSTRIENYSKILFQEWEKLVFEFLYALLNIDVYRQQLEGKVLKWSNQRDEIAFYISIALEKDIFAYPIEREGNLNIVIEVPPLPKVEIPLIEDVRII